MIMADTPGVIEGRCRALVENATDVIYWTDAQGHFTSVNPMATQVLGYPPEDLVGRHFTELIEPTHRAAALAFYRHQARERQLHSYYEFPAVAASGRTVWFGQNVRALLGPEAEVLGFEAVARDITDRISMEREREKLIAELKEALATVKVLRGLLPICSGCKMVRDDRGYWQQIENYLRTHTDAEFTHGLCPGCLQRYFDEIDKL